MFIIVETLVPAAADIVIKLIIIKVVYFLLALKRGMELYSTFMAEKIELISLSLS